MMLRAIKSTSVTVVCCLFIFFMTLAPGAHGLETEIGGLDLLFRIDGLPRLLDRLDEWGRAAGKPSSTSMLRSMLKGSGWIDPDRRVAGGIRTTDSGWKLSLLIPFQKPNESFQLAYGADLGPDYYLLTFPPDPASGQVPSGLRSVLVQASTSQAESALPEPASVRVTVALERLLSKNSSRIEAGLDKLETAARPADQANPPLTAQDARQMAEEMVATLRQVQTLEFGIDLGSDTVTFDVEAQAKTGSSLATLFSAGASDVYLSEYRPEHQLRFRTQAANASEVLNYFVDRFAGVYRAIGMNPDEIKALMNHFSGETVGGMSLHPGGADFEMIAVLAPGTRSEDFIESVYLPWIRKSDQTTTALLEKQTGQKLPSFYERTADSTVKGLTIHGVKSRLPIGEMPSQKDSEAVRNTPLSVETRLGTVGNLFLVAPDDQRMAALIDVARNARKKKAQGPAMTVQLKLGDYMNALQNWLPGTGPPAAAFTDLGRMVIESDWKQGRLSMRNTWQVGDISRLIADLKAVDKRSETDGKFDPAASRMSPSPQKTSPSATVRASKTKTATRTFDYWFEKGAICATYGNDKAAVRYFEKALKIDPTRSQAHFERGISLGEMGQYARAIAAIDKAIALGGRKGVYLYGRGRVNLLAGNRQAALEDFQEAASLNNRDAAAYLQLERQL